jgi:hypothetical protein
VAGLKLERKLDIGKYGDRALAVGRFSLKLDA